MAQHIIDTDIVATQINPDHTVCYGDTVDGDGAGISIDSTDDPYLCRVTVGDGEDGPQSVRLDVDQARHIAAALMSYVEEEQNRLATL